MGYIESITKNGAWLEVKTGGSRRAKEKMISLPGVFQTNTAHCFSTGNPSFLRV